MRDLSFLNESQLLALIRYAEQEIGYMRDKLETHSSTSDYDKVARVSGGIEALRHVIADCQSKIRDLHKKGYGE